MKITSRWNLRSTAGKLMLGLVLGLMIGGINAVPAFSKDHGNKGGYEHRGRGHDQVRYEHDRRRYGHDRYIDNRRGYRSYGYRQRGYDYYPPPPAIFIPPPPGISIFLPPIIIQP